MSFSDEYKAGFNGTGDAWNVDSNSYSYQMGQLAHDRSIREGGKSGEGIGGGGALVAVFAVILAVGAFVAAFMTYPISAGATAIAFGIGTVLFSGGAKMNGFGLVFALMVPCYIAYYLTWPLEQKAARYHPYQIFRQGWRIVVGTFIVHTLGTAFHLKSSYPHGAPFSGYLIDAGMTIVAPFLLYLNSMRLDKKYKLEPVAFRWLDLVIDPIKDRLIPRFAKDVLDTGVLRANNGAGGPLDVSVDDGTVTMGDVKVPIGRICEIEYERRHRVALIAGGIVLPFILIAIIGSMGDAQYRGFFQQIFGVASLAGGALSIFYGAVQGTPPGKIAGPFRYLNVGYLSPADSYSSQTLQFKNPSDERLFVQAIENQLKALPRMEANASTAEANQANAATA